MQAQGRPFLHCRQSRRPLEDGNRFLYLINRSQLSPIQIGGVIIIGVQLQRFTARFQSIIGAVERKMDRRQRSQWGGRVGIEFGGRLISAERFNEAIVAFRDGAAREELESFDVIQFTAIRRMRGNIDGRQRAILLGEQKARRPAQPRWTPTKSERIEASRRSPPAGQDEGGSAAAPSVRVGIIRRMASFS